MIILLYLLNLYCYISSLDIPMLFSSKIYACKSLPVLHFIFTMLSIAVIKAKVKSEGQTIYSKTLLENGKTRRTPFERKYRISLTKVLKVSHPKSSNIIKVSDLKKNFLKVGHLKNNSKILKVSDLINNNFLKVGHPKSINLLKVVFKGKKPSRSVPLSVFILQSLSECILYDKKSI